MRRSRSRLLLISGLRLVFGVALAGAAPKASEAEGGHRSRRPLPTKEDRAQLPPDGGPEFNRLVHETSPYLLQHCRNPVDWYPWGDAAFARARELNRPIFLSVGYSTCHWCHVMEHESFENEEVAKVLNAHFVSVKVDREERPDLDEIYMTVTQLVTGRGGWPNSVWLTPESKPFHAGTYFPRRSFLELLGGIAASWGPRREEIERQAERFAGGVRKVTDGLAYGSLPQGVRLDKALLDRVIGQVKSRFDAAHAGYGGAPKFPPHPTLRLFPEVAKRPDRAEVKRQLVATLDAMISGGIHDHVGGGFHRYATDRKWFLPHFEKMLYDNALIGAALARTFEVEPRPHFRDTATRLFDWVLREMTDPKTGGFYSALDADSEGEEGKFYLWTPAQVRAVLEPSDAKLFESVYSITARGTYVDEASGRRNGSSIPFLASPLAEFAKTRGLPLTVLESQLAAARAKLRQARDKRVWPALDDKLLTDWNGLMVSGLAEAGRVFDEPRYLQAAAKAGEFLWENLRKGDRLRHSYRQGEARIDGYLDDYAFLAQAYLDLHAARDPSDESSRGDGPDWLGRARALQETTWQEFWEPDAGLYFTTKDHETLISRSKDPLDGALPSGAGVVAQNWMRLYQHDRRPEDLERARSLLEVTAPLIQKMAYSSQNLALALLWYLDEAPEAGIAGDGWIREAPFKVRASLAPGVPPRRLQVELEMDEGWHIQTDAPKTTDLIATELRLEAGSAPWTLDGLRYPEAKAQRFEFLDESIEVFGGAIEILGEVDSSEASPTSSAIVPVELYLQPCDSTRCLPPRTISLPVPWN